MPETDLYSVEFFELQLRFADKVAELSGTTLAEAVASHTNLYVRLGMGQQFDGANPDWQEFVSALVMAQQPAEWTHAVHCRRAHLPTGPTLVATAGCFSYALVKPGRVRLHFHVEKRNADSPLSPANERLRKNELATLLAGLKASFGDDVHIVGASWLYNLPAYRRLFPEPYLASLRAVEHPYQRMPLWGQFLNRNGSVRPEVARCFLAQVEKANTFAALNSCFPFHVLATTAPARLLHEHSNAQRLIL